MILEAKFGDDYYASFVDLNKFKVRFLQDEAIEIENIDFVGCYTIRLKGDILCCHKHQCRSLSAFPNVYSRESIFLSKENSKIWFNYRNNNLESLRGLRKNEVLVTSEGFSWR